MRNEAEDPQWADQGYGFVARSRRDPASVDSWEDWRTYRRREGAHVTDEPVDV